jgi:hypothetical protein
MSIIDSRLKEHLQSQTTDIARKSSVPKRAFTQPPAIHPGMSERTNTTLGAPPRDNNPPDASSPSPVDHEKQHSSKQLPVPALHSAFKSDPQRGSYRPEGANEVLGEAILSGSTELPGKVTEN